MKEKLAKVFPIVVGIVIGWIIVYPPEVLAPLGGARYAVVAVLALALVLGATFLVVLRNLPEDLRIVPVDTPPESLGEVDAIARRLGELGFRSAGPLYRVELSPAVSLLGMVHESLPIYAAIYRTSTIPSITTFDLVSILSDERGGLTTTPEPRGVALPAFPGSLRQAIAGASVESIMQHHRHAMQMLEARGLSWRRLSASELIGDMRRAVARQRKAFLDAPLANALSTIWRSAVSRYPEARPLAKQDKLEPRIQQIISGETLEAAQG